MQGVNHEGSHIPSWQLFSSQLLLRQPAPCSCASPAHLIVSVLGSSVARRGGLNVPTWPCYEWCTWKCKAVNTSLATFDQWETKANGWRSPLSGPGQAVLRCFCTFLRGPTVVTGSMMHPWTVFLSFPVLLLSVIPLSLPRIFSQSKPLISEQASLSERTPCKRAIEFSSEICACFSLVV